MLQLNSSVRLAFSPIFISEMPLGFVDMYKLKGNGQQLYEPTVADSEAGLDVVQLQEGYSKTGFQALIACLTII